MRPPEVLQKRKQEVSFEETERQRRAYLEQVESLGNGHVVRADQPLEHVLTDVSEIVLRHLAQREARAPALISGGPDSARQLPIAHSH